MNIKTLLGALLLGLALPVAAEFQTVSLAHEVSLSNFRVPISLNSVVAYENCDDCEIESSRATPKTQYVVDGRAIPLREFREMVFQVKDRAHTAGIGLQHLETNTIVSVSVNF